MRALGGQHHVLSDDRALAVLGFIQRAARIDLHDFAQPLRDRDLVARERAPIASVREPAVGWGNHVRRAVDLIARVLVNDQEIRGPRTIRPPLVIRHDDRLFVAAWPPLHPIGVHRRRQIDDPARANRVVGNRGGLAESNRQRGKRKRDKTSEFSRASHVSPPS